MSELEPVQIGSITEFNATMVDLAERFNDYIRVKMLFRPRIWHSLIPKEIYPDGAGYSQKTFTFHPGVGDLAGLTTWERIQPSRAPGTLGPNDPGYDSCSYKAKKFDYGFTEREYVGYRTARQSPTVCYNDVRFKWQFAKQLDLIFGFMTEVTEDVWDNLCREAFINFAEKVVLTERAMGDEFSYDPFTSTDITVPASVFNRISMLTVKHLEYWRKYMAIECPEAASGNDNGIPTFELVVDAEDIETMIESNPKFWEAYLYADPNFLLEGFGKVKAFKGWAFLHDHLAPRFTVKGTSGSNVILRRVLPYIESNTTVGKRRRVNPEYLDAEYSLAIIRPKNVYKLRIPATKPANPGGGLQFGTVPTWGGEFYAINIRNEENNLLGEKCYFFARYAAFLEPLEHVEDAVVLLYKRCPKIERIVCSTPSTTDTQEVIPNSGEAIDVGEDGRYTQVRITLRGNLSVAAPANVTVTFANSSTAAAILTNDAQAPTYVITFASANTWLTYGGGIQSVSKA